MKRLYKNTFLILFSMIMLFCLTPIEAQANSTVKVNKAQGVLQINYSGDTSSIKVMVEHKGEKYFYDMHDSSESFSLQMGNGKYTVALLEKVNGKKYKVLSKETINFNNTSMDVYLSSIQNIEWDETLNAIKKATELTNDGKTDQEKVQYVYDYIVKNVKYDYPKISQMDGSYIPSVPVTYDSNMGICYDYSSLFAAMLRSIDVPTKLVKGYKSDIASYHAWNQVYVNDKWITVDTTYDSGLLTHGINYKMVKPDSEYTTAKFY